MDGNGWVKNWRKIEKWEWYTTPHMAHLFQHLIRQANHKPRRWRGVEIATGQLVTSLASLKAQTGISVRSIRTCLKHLKSTQELTSKATSRYTLITIANYESYQSKELPTDTKNDTNTDKRATSDRQTSDNKQEGKEFKNDKKKRKDRLFPIPGKVCGEKSCPQPAVYKTKGEYPHYYCKEHMPETVKALYE